MKTMVNKRSWLRVTVLALAAFLAFATCSDPAENDEKTDNIPTTPGTSGTPNAPGTPSTPSAVAVTGVSLKESTYLVVDNTETLFAIIEPDNATNKNVTWSSNNTAVATISSSGVVTGVSAGTAIIIVATKDGGYQAMCTVTVSPVAIPVTGISLNKSSANLVVGGTEAFTAEITPSNATNQNITWNSSNTAAATVSAGGVVTAVAAGETTITVAAVDGGYQAACTVTVINIKVTGVSLNRSTTGLVVGGMETLFATIEPNNAINKNVTWSSGNTAVATVSERGVVVAVSVGTADITVTTADGGYQAKCTVTVNPIVVTGVSLKESTYLVAGRTERLFAIIEPNNATNQNVIWISGNTDVATVSSDGVVTAVAAGTSVITVITVDGGHQATCEVTVGYYDVPVTGVSLKTSTGIVVGDTEDLIATITPYYATNQNITWYSNNTNVATVSEGGVVTAKNVGTATITVITDDGNKTASCYVTVNPKVITFTVDTIPAQTYTRSAIQPVVTVRDGSMELVQDIDYTVTYTNNINAGTATVTVNGKGNYAGSTGSGTFTINPKVITFTVDAIPAQTYTGSAIQPTVTVKDGSTALTLNTDYTAEYTNNVNAGTATVTISGAGNYAGSSGSRTFTINVTPTAADFDISGTTVYFDGNPKNVTITPKAGKSNGTITVKYDGSPTAPSAIGTYTVTFDVAAATGFSAASGLSAGTLTITPFTSIADLNTYLQGKPTNTAATPYIVALKVSSLGGYSSTIGSLGYVLRANSAKYVNLDLSSSTFSSFENFAFQNCASLTGVTIPNSVTSIGVGAFSSCTSLASVTIGNSVTDIGIIAFQNCTSLTGITIPNSVTSIGGGAFSGCTGLTSVTIPNSVTSIGGSAFSGCTKLTSVTFATGSNIADNSFGDNVFPEGSNGFGGNTLKAVYSTGKAGTYTRSSNGTVWTKK